MRRYFQLPWVAAVGLALLTPAAAHAQADFDARPRQDRERSARLFTGISERGDLQEAINRAVASALRSLPGADRMVRYRVRDITGEQGGIRGRNAVRVVIELVDGEPPRAERPESPDAVVTRGPLRMTLRVPERVAPGDQATFGLSLRNVGNESVRIPFASGQQFDFEVRRGNQLVWRWSADRAFTQALSSLTLRPGETADFAGRWNLRDARGNRLPPGEYTVRGYLTPRGDDRRLIATDTLMIGPAAEGVTVSPDRPAVTLNPRGPGNERPPSPSLLVESLEDANYERLKEEVLKYRIIDLEVTDAMPEREVALLRALIRENARARAAQRLFTNLLRDAGIIGNTSVVGILPDQKLIFIR